MPTLENPRYEAFAQARAKGAFLHDAYEGAGFVPHRGHPSRLAYRAEVAERIAELRAAQTLAEDNTPVALLGALTRIIKAGEGSEDPSVVREARLAIVDAVRLRRELEPYEDRDRAILTRNFKRFAEAQIRDTDPIDTEPTPLPAAQNLPPTSLAPPQNLPAIAHAPPRALPLVSPKSPAHLPGISPKRPSLLPLAIASAPPGPLDQPNRARRRATASARA